MENVLASPLSAAPPSKALVWAGRVLTGLVVAFLLFDGAIKLVPIAPVVEACQRLGYPAGIARPFGLLLVTCTVLHVIPRTQLMGGLLLTAYLGGATATHVRVHDPFIMPVLLGVFVWAGLYLRDDRLRALLPIRKT